MAEPTPAPAVAPAPAAPQAEKATPGAPQRGPDGKFAPAPKAGAQPEPPRRFKLHTGEEVDEAELLATATEKRVESRAVQAKMQRLAELEAQAAKWEDPRQALSREDQRKLAIQVAQEWQKEQEELSLPPEQQAFLRRERALAERERQIKEDDDRRTREAEQAQMEQFRIESVETVKTAVEISGLPKTTSTYKRLLVIMSTAAKNGMALPPEVLARKLRAATDAEAQETVKAMGGAQALRRNPALVEALNSLDDAEALRLLAPLGERLRRLALEGHGLKPSVPAPPGGNLRSIRPAQQDGPQDPWEAQKRIEERARR